MTKYYAGIGSRRAPVEMLEFATLVAVVMNHLGFTLYSGGADGMDRAFELGAGDKKQIFIPWKGFNNSDAPAVVLKEEAYKIAAEHHPNWKNLKESVRKLHTRNVYQVLGYDLKSPARVIYCWTPPTGGTTQALRIAATYNIPVLNWYNKEDYNKTREWLQKQIVRMSKGV